MARFLVFAFLKKEKKKKENWQRIFTTRIKVTTQTTSKEDKKETITRHDKKQLVDTSQC